MNQDRPQHDLPRNIVICCDGTGNKFGVKNTNIVKICEVLDRAVPDQVVYYDPGVGTMGDQRALGRIKKRWTRLLGAAIGAGLKDNVQEAYDFLAWHYRPGDRIYLFGFSRGAYTVRALAALLHMYGLTGPGCGNLSPYLLNMLSEKEGDKVREPYVLYLLSKKKNDERWHTANSFKKTFGRQVPIEFLGVFDTVSSVGWFWSPLRLPYTRKNSSVRCVRHAVSIDERRAFFRTNLFRRAENQDFKEVWFPGVHSDVGGGYSHTRQALAQIAFEWMIREAGLKQLAVSAERLHHVLNEGKYEAANPLAKAHRSLTWRWLVLEFLPKPQSLTYTFEDERKTRWQWPLYVNFFRSRPIPSQAMLHESVVERWTGNPRYRPRKLPTLDGHPVER